MCTGQWRNYTKIGRPTIAPAYLIYQGLEELGRLKPTPIAHVRGWRRRRDLGWFPMILNDSYYYVKKNKVKQATKSLVIMGQQKSRRNRRRAGGGVNRQLSTINARECGRSRLLSLRDASLPRNSRWKKETMLQLQTELHAFVHCNVQSHATGLDALDLSITGRTAFYIYSVLDTWPSDSKEAFYIYYI